MDVEKERLSGNFFMPNWVLTEHNARYRFAAMFTNGKIVVDCACGNGEGTAMFAEKAASVHGFDVSEEALTEARKKCPNPKANFTMASGTALPVGDEFADVFISLETIEHIDDDTGFLKEASRVLKKGGTFICSTPNRYVTNPGKTIAQKTANIFHIREYTEKEFADLLEKYFSKVEIYGQNLNMKVKAGALDFFGKFLPFHLAVRAHQATKLIAHFFRNKSYYEIRKKEPGFVFEYLTAVCTK